MPSRRPYQDVEEAADAAELSDAAFSPWDSSMSSCATTVEVKSPSVGSMSSGHSPPSPINHPPRHNDAGMYWFAHAADPPVEKVRRGLWSQAIEKDDDAFAGCGPFDGPLSKTDDEKDAELPGDPLAHCNSKGGHRVPASQLENKESVSAVHKEREERAKLVRERQEEDRRRKLHEIQTANLQAQRYREHLEVERRRKLHELRLRDDDRRQQVEERKRLIWEASLERKEAILRRNLERESKLEARKNAHRNSMSFAFGSSTPRTLDLDMAAIGAGRNLASNAVMLLSATSSRRSEEREMEGIKKRATSSYSLDHRTETGLRMSPTVEIEAKHKSRPALNSDETRACLIMLHDSPSAFPNWAHGLPFEIRTSGWLTGSGAVVGEDPMTQSATSLSSYSRGRRKTDLTPTIPWERDTSFRMHSPGAKKELPQSPTRPRSSMSGASEQSVASTASAVSMRPRAGPRRPRPLTIASIPVTSGDNSSDAPAVKDNHRQTRSAERKVATPQPKPSRAKSTGREQTRETPPRPPTPHKLPTAQKLQPAAAPAPRKPPPVPPAQPEAQVLPAPLSSETTEPAPLQESEPKAPSLDQSLEPPVPADDISAESFSVPSADVTTGEMAETEPKAKEAAEVVAAGKPRITSEEEARAALAEKRRLAREQAEREAELERQRQEELRRQEEERQRKEEEEQRIMEEEQLRLAEEHRRQEEEKLQRAIREQEKREEEEQRKQEEEARLKAEREEQEKKAREEAEKQRIELEEKLKREEAERAERKKRVEAIMSRTRGKPAVSGKVLSPDEGKTVLGQGQGKVLPISQASTLGTGTHNMTVDEEARQNSSQEVVPLGARMNGTAVFQTGTPTIGEKQMVIELEPVSNKPSKPEVILDSQNLGKTCFVDSISEVSEQKQVPVDTTLVIRSRDSEVTKTVYYETSLESVIPQSKKLDSYLFDSHTLQTNGYSSHEEEGSAMNGSSPEDKSEVATGSLLDFESTLMPQHTSQHVELEQLIDLGSDSSAADNLNTVGDVNSNRVPDVPFIAFEDNTTSRKQDPPLTDLLS